MFDRLSRSWHLTKASWAVLRQDRQLLVFPLISVAAALVVIVAFGLGALGLGSIDGIWGREVDRVPVNMYVLGFLFYVSLYFVMFYCNAALVAAALIRFDGGVPTVGDGLKMARAKAGRILGYAVIAATVGVLLRAIQERVGFLARFVVGFIGAGWTIATFMVVPVLVSRDVGPLDAVKESAGILKKTWGENVVGQAGISLAFIVIHLGVAVAGFAFMFLAGATGNMPLLWLAIAATVVAEMIVALVHVALTGIYAAALYRYATGGSAGAAFDAGALKTAFAPK